MKLRTTAAVCCVLAGLAAAAPAPQRPEPDEVSDVLLRINGPLRVAPGESVSTAGVIDHDAVVEGTVREQLFIVNGTGRVSGTVLGDVVVVNGRLELGPGARVGRDVLLIRSTMTRAPGASIGGVVQRERWVSLGPVVGWLLWAGATVITIVLGLVFAALAGRQLREAARLITTAPGPTILTAVILFLGLPLLAVASFLTLVGIPLGLLVLLILIPTLALLGYVVAGAGLGGALVRRLGRPREGRAPAPHPYLAVVIGILLLQVLAAIPVVGGLILLVASQLGAGALVYRAWRARQPQVAA